MGNLSPINEEQVFNGEKPLKRSGTIQNPLFELLRTQTIGMSAPSHIWSNTNQVHTTHGK